MNNSILVYLHDTVARFPDKVAFQDSERKMTFYELDRKARQLAYIIHRKLNGQRKKAIGVYLPNNVGSIVTFMAVLYSGNFYTPLDIMMPKDRLDKILDTLKPEIIISSNKYNGKIVNEKTVLIETVLENENLELIDMEIMDRTIDTDIMYVMFTSGSTGVPKGVIVTHRAVIDYIDWVGDTFHFDDTTVFGNQAPFYFDNSVLDIYSTIKNGSTMNIIPKELFLSGPRLCQYINEHKINTIFWVPSALALVANSKAFDSVPVNCLKNVLFAGEVMQVKHLNEWRRHVPDALYANLYGPTEIAVDCTYYIVDREFTEEESLPIGQACRNSDVIVLNKKDELVGINEEGELCVRGSSLALGYYGDPQKTKEVFVQNPLNSFYAELIYRTGDMVKYNDLGEIIYIGRKDFQIKHSGYRIELGEIENAFTSIEGVESACCIYDDVNKKIVLFAAPEDLDKKQIYSSVKNVLPRYMLPGQIVTMSKLPLNSNGKINRLELKRIYAEE